MNQLPNRHPKLNLLASLETPWVSGKPLPCSTVRSVLTKPHGDTDPPPWTYRPRTGATRTPSSHRRIRRPCQRGRLCACEFLQVASQLTASAIQINLPFTNTEISEYDESFSLYPFRFTQARRRSE